MNPTTITISLLLLAAGIAAGCWARGASDARAWTNQATNLTT